MVNMDLFEKELRAAQVPLLSYISTLCGVPQEADDILGEANLTLIRERNAYDASRPFLVWARSVAYYAVLAWRTRRARSRLVFDDELIGRLAEELGGDAGGRTADAESGRRLRALAAAKRELTPEMQYLLTRRYEYGDSLEAIGAQLDRPAASVAVSLCRIRAVLKKSVLQKLTEDE
mgnify:CR=1 FL=1